MYKYQISCQREFRITNILLVTSLERQSIVLQHT